MSNDKADMLLDEMTNEELKDLYKEAEKRSDEGYKWLKQYSRKNKNDPFEYKNPYWHILYTCKDILGDRVVND